MTRVSITVFAVSLHCAGCTGAIIDETHETDGGSGSAGDDSSGDPSGDPEPDADGYVNCGELSAGGPTIGPGEPGPLGFPEAACNPRADNTGSSYTCCSDDPAAFEGTPIFSRLNNALGTSGMCVRTADLPAGSGVPEPVAANCPIPCNPTWESADVEAVCGASRSCCQTRAIEPEDCVQGDDGTWRPASGDDILAGITNWAPDRHATHQDPGGQGCATFSGTSDLGNAAFSGCLEALSVADQRGYCITLAPGQACPGSNEPDACDQINMGIIPPPG